MVQHSKSVVHKSKAQYATTQHGYARCITVTAQRRTAQRHHRAQPSTATQKHTAKHSKADMASPQPSRKHFLPPPLVPLPPVKTNKTHRGCPDPRSMPSVRPTPPKIKTLPLCPPVHPSVDGRRACPRIFANLFYPSVSRFGVYSCSSVGLVFVVILPT